VTQPSLFGDAVSDIDDLAGIDDAPDVVEASTMTDHVRVDEVLMFCDGGSRGNPGPSAIGAVVFDPSNDPPTVLAEVSEYIGVTTNNVAEYKAMIAGLEAAARFSPRRVLVRADSKLVIEQVKGTWKVKQPHLQPLRAEARRLVDEFEQTDLRHVPRAQNAAADALVNQALDALTD
jgi:ribonuclease HI